MENPQSIRSHWMKKSKPSTQPASEKPWMEEFARKIHNETKYIYLYNVESISTPKWLKLTLFS